MARLTIYQLLACILAIFAPGCGPPKPAPAAGGPPTQKVRVAEARAMTIEETVRATGSLVAKDRAMLSAKVPGRMWRVHADLGLAVRQGALLAEMERLDFELKRRQAEAAVAQARARLGLSLSGEEDEAPPEQTSIVKEAAALLAEAAQNRDRLMKLREQGIIPDSETETAEAQFLVASSRHQEAIHEARNRAATLKLRRAELDLALQQEADTAIRSPFDGVVEQRFTSPGEYLNAGAPVLSVVRIDPIRVRLEIAERDAGQIPPQAKFHLWVQGSGQAITGQLARLSPVISTTSRMLVAEADLPNSQGTWRPGAFVKADVVIDPNARGVFVPTRAVVTFAGMTKVFSIEGSRAVEQTVRLGRKHEDWIEVVSGISAGTQVVVEPGNLRNGQTVAAAPGDS